MDILRGHPYLQFAISLRDPQQVHGGSCLGSQFVRGSCGRVIGMVLVSQGKEDGTLFIFLVPASSFSDDCLRLSALDDEDEEDDEESAGAIDDEFTGADDESVVGGAFNWARRDCTQKKKKDASTR
jgi:hypothetical protein